MDGSTRYVRTLGSMPLPVGQEFTLGLRAAVDALVEQSIAQNDQENPTFVWEIHYCPIYKSLYHC